jgi:SnoaL-like domain
MSRRRPTQPTSRYACWLAFAGSLLASPCLAGDATSPMQSYFNLIHAYSVGDLDLAVAHFSETAVVVAGPRCTEDEPCVGRAAILERYLVACRQAACAPPLADQRFDGSRLTTRGEVVGGHRLDGAAQRLMGGHVFEFRDGRIESLRVALDPNDAQTAAFIARRSARDVTGTVAASVR